MLKEITVGDRFIKEDMMGEIVEEVVNRRKTITYDVQVVLLDTIEYTRGDRNTVLKRNVGLRHTTMEYEMFHQRIRQIE